MVKRPCWATAACAACRIAAAAASARAAVSATRTSRGAALMDRSYLFVERPLPCERGAEEWQHRQTVAVGDAGGERPLHHLVTRKLQELATPRVDVPAFGGGAADDRDLTVDAIAPEPADGRDGVPRHDAERRGGA